MTMSDEHQQRWVALKSPSDPALVTAMRQGLQTSIEAGARRLAELAQRLAADQDIPSFYETVERCAEVTRTLVRVAYGAKRFLDWNVEPVPEFTDHYINHYFLWPDYKRAFWLEGAVLSALAMVRGGRYLELCCGSGYYADLFYAAIAREIVAVDFDPRAIELASRQHARDNVRYQVLDIRQTLPEGPFDGVIWDGAIEHFSLAEIDAILPAIKRRLVPGGVLSGYTVAETGEGVQHPDHEQEFKGMDDLAARLRPHFAHVLVFESLHTTIAPPRHNLFFFAGDGTLPFDGTWPHCRRF